VIGRQAWISVHSSTGRGIDIILSLNIQQECILSLIVVEKYVISQQHLPKADIPLPPFEFSVGKK
jgi:hypothetical protein